MKRGLKNLFQGIQFYLDQYGPTWIVVGAFAAASPMNMSIDQRSVWNYHLRDYDAAGRVKYHARHYLLLKHFNKYLRGWALGRSVHVAPVDQKVNLPGDFVDTCHMTDAGVERMAKTFAPAVSQAIHEHLLRIR